MTTLYIMGHCLQPLAQKKVSLYGETMQQNRVVVRAITTIKRMGGGTMRF